MTNAAQALEQRGKEVAKPTLIGQIQGLQDQFQMAMPKGLEAQQLVRDAITAIRQTPKLAECEPASVMGALMTCAQLGLRPGVLGHAWVLPFKDWKTKTLKAQIIIGYQGMIDLAYRSNKIETISARAVHENDIFDYEYGLDEKLTHKPTHGTRGKLIATYAVAKTMANGKLFVVLELEDIEAARRSSKQADGKTWTENYEGMALKTAVRQLFKLLPKSTEISTAMAADEGVRLDYSVGSQAESTTQYVEAERVDQPAEPTPEPPKPATDTDARIAEKVAAMKEPEVNMATGEVLEEDPWVTTGKSAGQK
jgi:recombination protein RecT